MLFKSGKIFVITSYSIHYKKLYDITHGCRNGPVMKKIWFFACKEESGLPKIKTASVIKMYWPPIPTSTRWARRNGRRRWCAMPGPTGKRKSNAAALTDNGHWSDSKNGNRACGRLRFQNNTSPFNNVITSYSIHYTKLYDAEFVSVFQFTLCNQIFQ